MRFTDLHSHVAWDIDDGIPDQAQAEQALQLYAREGITAVASTPHILPRITDRDAFSAILRRQQELSRLARAYGVTIYQGSEVMLNSSTLQWIRDGMVLPLNGSRYLLVEFNVRTPWPANKQYEPLLATIAMMGYIPVIAHVERYFAEGIDWDVVEDWFQNEYVLQVNATSLLGKDSRSAQRNAWTLLEEGYAHVVATDTHTPGPVRSPQLQEAYAQVKERIGSENARLLFSVNPNRILRDEAPEDIAPTEKPGFWERLKKFRK